MTSGGSAYGGRTEPVRVVESNGVVESKVRTGIPSAVASPDLRKDSGSARTVFGPVKEMFSESLERCRDGIERTGSVAGIGVASVQGRPGGRKDRRRSTYAKQMVVD